MEATSACPVVPESVQRYIDEVCASLRHIADCEGEHSSSAGATSMGEQRCEGF